MGCETKIKSRQEEDEIEMSKRNVDKIWNNGNEQNSDDDESGFDNKNPKKLLKAY